MDSSAAVKPIAPMKFRWKKGRSAPKKLAKVTASHGNTAYFISHYGHEVYSFSWPEEAWTLLPELKYSSSALAVVHETLVAIGGSSSGVGSWHSESNSLFSLFPKKMLKKAWQEILPPMPTRRSSAVAVFVDDYLVVAGGQIKHKNVDLIEILNMKTLQWSTVCSLPLKENSHLFQMAFCKGNIYRHRNSKVYSCSLEDLLNSCELSSDNCSVWTELENISAGYASSMVVVKDHVVNIRRR